jgi:hypothetical protein
MKIETSTAECGICGVQINSNRDRYVILVDGLTKTTKPLHLDCHMKQIEGPIREGLERVAVNASKKPD